MVLPIEIRLIDREGVNQMFDLMVRIGSQRGEVRLERLLSSNDMPVRR
jgi:hypothetical protein